MTDKTMDSGSSPDNKNLSVTKSTKSLNENTKMFILPPNLLQNIHISDSMMQDESIISSVGLMKKNSTSQIEQVRSKMKPTTHTDDAISKDVTKVPQVNKNEEKLISKINDTKRRKSCKKEIFLVSKQKNNKKIDDSRTGSSINQRGLQKATCKIDNVKSDETTSIDTENSQETETEDEQSESNVNLKKLTKVKSKTKIDEIKFSRSKRIRKQTNFEDYIVTYKNESLKTESTPPNQKGKHTPYKEQKQVHLNTLSDNEINNITNDRKSIKEVLQSTQNKKSGDTIDSYVESNSGTPVVTRKSLPLNINSVSEDHSNAETNENNLMIKDSKDVVSNIHMASNDDDIIEQSDENDTKTYMGSKSTLLKNTITKRKHLEINSELNVTESLCNKSISGPLNSKNKNSTHDDTTMNKIDGPSIVTPDLLKQDNLSVNSSQIHTDCISVTTPPVRKRGRPRKYPIQQVLNTSNEVGKDSEATQKIDNISIADTVINTKRHSEKSYNTSNNDLSDDSSIESNTSSLPIIRKRGRPPGTSGRGRGRGRGKGRGSSQTTLDIEYKPKLKGPNTDNTEEGSSTETTDTSQLNVDVVICAKCEQEVSRKQWNSHNLLKHNNMSWKKDDEPLDFENDIKLWKRVLMDALKKKKGQLCCEKCATKKRSVNGFISHMQFCGKSDEERRALMATCPVCGAVMMPSSLEIHERTHRLSAQITTKKLQSYTPETEKVKRKAAEKAVSKILEFTELVKDNLPSDETKVTSSFLRNIIKSPKQKKTIPSAWKTIWRKELSSQGTATCRQIGCTYTCSSYEDICKHVPECTFTPEECFICKICKFSSTSDADMIKHVTENHAKTEESSKYSDFEAESYSSDENKKGNYTMKFLEKEQMLKIRWGEPYFPAIRWTMEFEEKNYDLHLFNDYVPNHFTLLNNVDATKYLPELEISIRTKKQDADSVKLSNTEISWKQWKRFEGGFDEDTATFFVGGPIWALAWLPIPSPMYSKNPSQYVAISTHPTMEAEYTVRKSYSGPNIIQIWNVGPLDHEKDNKKETPFLSYAIAHNAGTIWCLEWCPSGCYQEESLNNYKMNNETQSNLKRMGMLAAASSDGAVHIYSLPFPEELKFEKTTENEWPIYYTDPIMTLVVNTAIHDKNNQNWQCTKLSWSKEHGHNIIAAGFSNGYIALWDLTFKSPLLMEKRQNTYFINAFEHFYAHGNAVTMVALIPYNGARFLASGSLDRSYKIWDLENTSSPQSCAQKGIIVNGSWMTNWPCAIISFDDALGYKHTNSYIIPLREHEYKYFPILATNSPTYALTISDYANGIAHGTLAGEIITIFPHQLIYSRDLDKALQKKRKLSSAVKIVDFSENSDKNDTKDENSSKDYCYMPGTYNECKDRFGIIFCDSLKNIERNAQQGTLHAEKLTPVPIEEYPFMSINRMSWNPNVWSYLWLASAYQNGLVRLLNFNYMSASCELKMCLPQHIERMLKKTEAKTEKSS